jgi:hypothetical protein
VNYFIYLILVVKVSYVALLALISVFVAIPGFLTRFRGLIVFNSYVALAELEERRVWTVSGHRLSSLKKFLLTPIQPPL